MKKQWEILLIRHGATAANKDKCYLGQTDQPLSEEGRQMLMAPQQKYPPAEIFFSSPMLRCMETCQILYNPQKIHVIEAWREIDFGDFEGKNYRDLQGDARYQAWIDSNGTLAFPNGESREDFIRRSRSGFEQMVARMKKEEDGKNVACIVHGGTIMALLSSYYGGEYYDYLCKNGEGYRCRVTEDGGICLVEPFRT